MGCWDYVGAGIREQESMLIFNASGPMPDGLFELCKLLGLVNND